MKGLKVRVPAAQRAPVAQEGEAMPQQTFVQSFAEGELLGITISRSPYLRASNESAPGPRQMMAIETTVAKTEVALLSKRLREGTENHESPATRLTMHDSAAANRVR